MLTIKVIGKTGCETVREATSVHMITKEHMKLQTNLVYYFAPGESTAIDITEGDVYVMNEHGKTIADYHMRFPNEEKAD